MPALKKRPEQLREEAMTKTFKKALIDKGWKQAHLAKLLKVDSSKVNKVINHPLKREFHAVLEVADKLGVPLISEEIYRWKED